MNSIDMTDLPATPIVSVLMTAYNREKLIGEAIESVLCSTYTQFELIISDDASTDGTVAIAQSYAEKDSRVRIFANATNLGDYFNRNIAAGYAQGRYIKYLDSDDKLYPDGLAVMVEAMERHPEAALGIAQFPDPEIPNSIYPQLISSETAYLEHYYGKGILRFGPTGTILRSDVLSGLGGFKTDRFTSDTAMWLQLAALYPVVKIRPDVVWWRQHAGQEFEIGHKTYTYLRKAYPIYVASLKSPNCPLQQEDVKRVLARLQWKHARDILSLAFAKRNPSLAWLIYREADFGFLQLLKGILPYKHMKKTFQHHV